MVLCAICSQEMLDRVSCSPDPMVLRNGLYEPIRWTGTGRYRSRGAITPCPDCRSPYGGVHHHGCDMEPCPACHRQAITCGCQDPDEDDFW